MTFYGFADPSSLSCKKRSWSHLCFAGQHFENIFKALDKNFYCLAPPLSTWVDENQGRSYIGGAGGSAPWPNVSRQAK